MTMARLDLFLAEGLQVVYIWEHDFREWQKEVSRRQARMSQDWGWLDRIIFQGSDRSIRCILFVVLDISRNLVLVSGSHSFESHQAHLDSSGCFWCRS